MPLESTIICVDNSEYMRNGDYIPTRLQAQQDAVNTVCRYKLLANPENNVGLLTLANTEVLATLTTDGGKILTSLHKVQPQGLINLFTGIRIAHLALKHRQSKNHKMRIVVFVGSPITTDEKDVIKIAKRLKKENVNVDIVNFGETEDNKSLLEAFVNTMNGREGTGSHLVTVPPSPHLADALLSSPIIQGEDGTGPTNFGASGGGFDFGVDPNEDPELALALRVSMEEQRQRQQQEERRTAQQEGTATTEEGGTTAAPAAPAVPVTAGEAADVTTASASTVTTPSTDTTPTPAATPTKTTTTTITSAAAAVPVPVATEGGPASEEEMLQQALAMSLESGGAAPTALSSTPAAAPAKDTPTPAAPAGKGAGFPDFSTMTEEEQIAYAMQISLQGCQSKDEPMDVDDTEAKGSKPKGTKKKKEDEAEKIEPDFSEVMSDPAFLQDVLQSLPGVDPQSKVIRQAVGSLTGQDKEKDKEKEKEKDKKKGEEKADK